MKRYYNITILQLDKLEKRDKTYHRSKTMIVKDE
jgi:hypothetical protein